MSERVEIAGDPGSKPEYHDHALSRQAAESFRRFKATPRHPLLVSEKSGATIRTRVGIDEVGTVIDTFERTDGAGYGLVLKFDEVRENMPPATGERVVGHLICRVEDPLSDLMLRTPENPKGGANLE